MSISIIDNFELGADKPMDNRFVVGPGLKYETKAEITHKYTGLKTWDINDGLGYLWNGSSWELDPSSETIAVGPGSTSSIAKFTSSGNIGNSIMVESSGKITVSGILQASNLVGAGSNITNINANNISSGVLSLSRIQGSTNSIVVSNGVGLASSWLYLDDVTVGNSNKVEITNSSTGNHYLLSSLSDGSQGLYKNNSLVYKPLTDSLMLCKTSIGTDGVAPDYGLLVSGNVVLSGLNSYTESSTQSFTLVTDGTGDIKLDTGITIPYMGIILWNDDDLPRGFGICDGSTYLTPLGTASSPDMRQRFLFGAGNAVDVNTPGPESVGDENSYYGLTGVSASGVTASGMTHSYRSMHYIMYVGYPIIATSR